jgi:predicted SprT family Zn-dependent metalloprotease
LARTKTRHKGGRNMIVYRCDCGYLISEKEFCSANFDYTCPRCEGSLLTTFHRVSIEVKTNDD